MSPHRGRALGGRVPARWSGRRSGLRPLASALLALLALLTLGTLSGCPQRTTEPPQEPPTIYVDPPDPAPSSDGEPVSADGDEGPAPERAQPSERTFTPTDPATPSDQPGFRDTLEGIPSEAPADGRDGVPGATTCEGGARQVGESWKVKCNSCSCQASGEVICTLMACVSVDDV
jgi:hypothetical protein